MRGKEARQDHAWKAKRGAYRVKKVGYAAWASAGSAYQPGGSEVGRGTLPRALCGTKKGVFRALGSSTKVRPVWSNGAKPVEYWSSGVQR